MKSNSGSLAVKVLAVCAVFVSAFPVINAQTLQPAPDNPAFIQYQHSRAQKAAAVKTVSEYGRGYIPPPVDFSYLKGRTPAGMRALQALPSSYDLRTLGRLTPIKNQSSYGTCWAFATYGSLESALLTGETNNFKLSSIGYVEIALTQTLGGSGYMPCPGDYDGDGLADPAVKSISGNEWIVMFSSGGYAPTPLTILFE